MDTLGFRNSFLKGLRILKLKSFHFLKRIFVCLIVALPVSRLRKLNDFIIFIGLSSNNRKLRAPHSESFLDCQKINLF